MSKIYHVFIEFSDSFLSIGYFSKKGVAKSVKKKWRDFLNIQMEFLKNLKIGIQRGISGINKYQEITMKFLGTSLVNMMKF